MFNPAMIGMHQVQTNMSQKGHVRLETESYNENPSMKKSPFKTVLNRTAPLGVPSL